jgi:hypothetical protein
MYRILFCHRWQNSLHVYIYIYICYSGTGSWIPSKLVFTRKWTLNNEKVNFDCSVRVFPAGPLLVKNHRTTPHIIPTHCPVLSCSLIGWDPHAVPGKWGSGRILPAGFGDAVVFTSAVNFYTGARSCICDSSVWSLVPHVPVWKFSPSLEVVRPILSK